MTTSALNSSPLNSSPLNSAVAKLEAANLTDAEIDSLAEALALTLAGSDDEVEGFIDASSPKHQDLSLNYATIKAKLRDQIRTPGNIWVVVEGYSDPGRVSF